ncbi:serine hydrolase [Cellulophaga sp. Hel_I_12]|uniref:serine hydrolase domain-containing protein n=1 Tax=Cellulophaga sp. Hel_I_12 TaxID=1249972 RepID=UPI000ACFA571|nr:serine hydrolase domain-containing protein [Cellulophaga sp. Hel_I_12]
MKKIIIILFLVFTNNTIYSQKSKKIDTLLLTYEKANQFSGSVLVAEKGNIIFEKSYGYRNTKTKEKNTNSSIYRIYSTTKIFTATVILKLEEQGRLSLNDKLSKYYPDYPKGDSITIANMLSHTSGIPDGDLAEITINEEALLKDISEKPLNFSPGKSWGYSNVNYYLLGYIIKKITGIEYDKVIEDIVLNPLQMNNSGFHFNDLKNENKALGYEFMSGKNSNEALQFKTDHPFAAGAMYSTVEDLYKFSAAIKKGEILNKKTVDKAQTPFLNDHYGFGYDIQKILNKNTIGHSGVGPGYRCQFFKILEDDITIIILVNSEMVPMNIAEKITGIMTDNAYEINKIPKISKNHLQKIEGVYSSKDGNFYLKNINGMLVFSGGNMPRIPLTPTSKNTFNFGEQFKVYFKTTPTEEIESVSIDDTYQGIKNANKVSDTFPWGIIGTATSSGCMGKILHYKKIRLIYII